MVPDTKNAMLHALTLAFRGGRVGRQGNWMSCLMGVHPKGKLSGKVVGSLLVKGRGHWRWAAGDPRELRGLGHVLSVLASEVGAEEKLVCRNI